MMKVVEWIGEESRIVAGYGVGTPGKAIELPETLAEKFIQQGQARELNKPTRVQKGNKSTEGEEA
jgi:hypothetical protein